MRKPSAVWRPRRVSGCRLRFLGKQQEIVVANIHTVQTSYCLHSTCNYAPDCQVTRTIRIQPAPIHDFSGVHETARMLRCLSLSVSIISRDEGDDHEHSGRDDPCAPETGCTGESRLGK